MITMEGWSKIMYMYMDAQGKLVSFYFLALMLIGSFFLLNLILAVIMRSFTENDEREKNKLKDAKIQELTEKKEALKQIQEESRNKTRTLNRIFRRTKSAEFSSDSKRCFEKLIEETPASEEEIKDGVLLSPQRLTLP